MRTAQDIMSTDPITVQEDMPISEAAIILLENDFNGVPVLNAQGSLTGLICQSDIIAQEKTLNTPSFFTVLDTLIPLQSMSELDAEVQRMTASIVKEAMSPNPKIVEPNTGIDKIASLMVDASFHTIPVVDKDKLVGIIGMADLLRHFTGAEK